MNRLVLTVLFSICAVVWLVLLVATGFSPAIVSAGLIAGLFVTGSPPRRTRHLVSYGASSTRR
jgi:hypothetical protein